jgi:hypothetical protein
MRIVTYQRIKELAAQLAGRTTDNLPTTEVTMLRAFFAAQLPDLWNREAWPELCDHLEAVTLDSENCFDKRLTAADEMGDILALIQGADPRTSNQVTVLGRERYVDFGSRVNVLRPNQSNGTSTTDTAPALYVDWQTPAPNLLATTYDTEATLNALELPERFLLPLAMRGAALLLADEDPGRAAAYRGTADNELIKQAARITRPWWRKGGQ